MAAQRLLRLREALQSDRAMTNRQARSLYRVTRKEAASNGILITTKTVKPSAYSNEYLTIPFLVADEAVARYSGPQLRHLAGVVELRRQLGIAPSAWSSEAAAPLATFVPDAVWRSEKGLVAIEYDAGSYSADTVRNKGEAFQEGYARQVWGVALKDRVPFVRGLLEEKGVTNAEVRFAPWAN